MYDTSGTSSVCQFAHIDYDIAARTGWLRAEVARAEQTRLRARREREEQEAMRLLNPKSRREAFRRFGMFLGLLPPAAIFWRMFGGEVLSNGFEVGWFLLLVAMNVVCCFVGRALGGNLIRLAPEEAPDFGWPAWLRLLAASFFIAMVWGIATGAAGGALFFGLGTIAGAIMAVPVALVGFPVFASLHRLLARDGMIEERQLWPLAFGIPSVIAAAIIGIQ